MLEHLFAARAQMAMSLAFHIIFAALGIGLPLLLCIAEGLWLRTKNPAYLALARQWSKAAGLLFVVGAVSGTVLSFELGLLWPGFMALAGDIIGMPFSLEGFAFFIEAIFLALYIYGWRRFSPFAHWLLSIPVVLSSALSGIFVVMANAWMNTPTGFTYKNGIIYDIDPVAAMFNPAWKVQTLHMTLAAYLSVAFSVAAVYAVALLRGKNDAYNRRGLMIALAVAAVMVPLQIISGDLAARFVAQNQPVKLAAMEGQFQTENGAPLRIGGIPDPSTHTTKFALEIPHGLSILVYDDPNAMIKGLDSFAPDTPNPIPVHLGFQIMVALGFLMLGLAGWFWLMAWRKHGVPVNRWLLRAVAASGPLGYIAIEAGWTVTEVGRQPWIIYGILRTKDPRAVTPAGDLDFTFLGFTLLYIGLSILLVWLLLKLGEKRPMVESPPQDDTSKTGDHVEEEKRDHGYILP